MPTLTFATTTYNETVKDGQGQWLLECLQTPIVDERITEIVISDDHSHDYEAMRKLVEHLPKVKLFRLPQNRGPFGNKLESVRQATGDWVIIGDSDNVIGPDYIDKVSQHLDDPTRLLCPTYAATNFDYRHLGGQIIGPGDFSRMAKEKLFQCFCNTGNWTVPRVQFVKAFERFLDKPRFDLEQPDYLKVPWRDTLRHRQAYDSADSFFINRAWLAAESANRLYAVPDLTYIHRWRLDSTYGVGGAEKEMLPAIYHMELLAQATGAKHEWRALGRGKQGEIYLQRSSATQPVGSACDELHLSHHDYSIMKIQPRKKI